MKKILLILSALITQIFGQASSLELGQIAPDFILPGSDGQNHSLSNYRGQIVVLAWFPKAFTGG